MRLCYHFEDGSQLLPSLLSAGLLALFLASSLLVCCSVKISSDDVQFAHRVRLANKSMTIKPPC